MSTTTSFAYTGTTILWTVPLNISPATITVTLNGAGGATASGGAGGRVTGVLAVTPGEVLRVNVGGVGGIPIGAAGGLGGFNGGGNGGFSTGAGGAPGYGGGGASDVRRGGTALANRVAVAAGGGGVGRGSGLGSGGDGGGATGQAGVTGAANGGTAGIGGGGGTPTAGGALGAAGTQGSAGSSGAGGTANGAGTASACGGGGGGGGYFGGGGGGAAPSPAASGGGGGGSNYTGGLTGVVSSARATGAASGQHGSITFSYNLAPNSPLLVVPVTNANIDQSQGSTFAWQFSDPDPADAQSKADFQWRVGTGVWTVISNVGALDSFTFEGGTIGAWTPGGSIQPTLANSTVIAHSGTRSLLATWGTGGSLPLFQLIIDTPKIGSTYTVSAWVYVTAGSASPPVLLFVGSGGDAFYSAASTLKDRWVQLNVTFVAGAATSGLQVWPSVAPVAGQQVWLDDVQVDEGAVVQPFSFKYTVVADAWIPQSGQQVEWGVRTYDLAGAVGPWRTGFFFRPRPHPADPAITNASVLSLTPSVTFTTETGMVAYQARILPDVAGSASGAALSDTGTVAVIGSPASGSVTLPAGAYVSGDSYHTQVRWQQYPDVWSDWADSGVLVGNINAPLQPSLALSANGDTASIQVTVVNPGADPYPPSHNDIFRTDLTHGSPEIRVATAVALNGTWTDWTPASDTLYRYRAVAVTALGANTSSA